MTHPAIKQIDGGVTFIVKAVPGSSKTDICGLLDRMLKIKIATAAEKGKANQSLIECLADRLGVRKNAISLLSGNTSPVKHIQVLGISAETASEKLGLNRLNH